MMNIKDNFKLKYIVKKMLQLSVFGLLVIPAAHAVSFQEWPVSDAGVRKALAGLADMNEKRVMQQSDIAKLNENNAISNNMNRAMSQIIESQGKAIADSAPDLQKCQILTQNMSSSQTIGKQSEMSREFGRQVSIENTSGTGLKSNAHSKTLDFKTIKGNTVQVKTCTAIDVANGVNNCQSESDIDPIYQGGDTDVSFLTENKETGTITLNDKGVAVAAKYIKDLGGNIPKSATAGKNNSAYAQKIDQLNKDINVAKDVLRSITARYMPLPFDSSNNVTWLTADNAAEYKKFFQVPIPENPSFMDRLRLEVYQDAFGKKAEMLQVQDGLAQQRMQNQLLARQSLLSFYQLQEAEHRDILLATLITQISNLDTGINDPTKLTSAGQ